MTHQGVLFLHISAVWKLLWEHGEKITFSKSKNKPLQEAKSAYSLIMSLSASRNASNKYLSGTTAWSDWHLTNLLCEGADLFKEPPKHG